VVSEAEHGEAVNAISDIENVRRFKGFKQGEKDSIY
jgi:hypothetical protein